MSSYQNVKKAVRWQHPAERNSCGNCHHVKREPNPQDIGKVRLTCGKHGFYTLPFGLCEQWKERV